VDGQIVQKCILVAKKRISAGLEMRSFGFHTLMKPKKDFRRIFSKKVTGKADRSPWLFFPPYWLAF
jgi:hypothetical protein